MALQGEGDHEIVGKIEGFEIEPIGYFEYVKCSEGGSYDGFYGSPRPKFA